MKRAVLFLALLTACNLDTVTGPTEVVRTNFDVYVNIQVWDGFWRKPQLCRVFAGGVVKNLDVQPLKVTLILALYTDGNCEHLFNVFEGRVFEWVDLDGREIGPLKEPLGVGESGILFVMSDPINHQAVEYLWALWNIHVETYGGSVEEIESKHAVRVSLR